ncbi:DUF5343 domain-containing protein [Fodinibius halophilus]|uniref:DUF5343 domain-containing protein n=1 Tax=Fodinibius halophilus TaxID=1736908 RepID=A0A6M1T228_9BACT|nr:DUF5343 domain-containing protein [Fodinibius halophilus]NGP88049.1 DUF5343 domain-containing protein [Fodinibius halophilus]
MKVSEAFLVNTKNFDTIINALVNHNAEEITIDSDLLERLGYADPNDLLVVRLLKDLDIIDNDGNPSTHFEEFKNPDTTHLALAKGLITAYEDVFKNYPKLYQASPDQVKEAFVDLFKDKKTDLIIKYISNTFYEVVNYVGINTVTSVLGNHNNEPEPVESGVAELSQAGSYQTKNLPSGETIGKSDVEDIISRLSGAQKNLDNNARVKDEESPVQKEPESPEPTPPPAEDEQAEAPSAEKEDSKESETNKVSENPVNNQPEPSPAKLDMPLNKSTEPEVNTQRGEPEHKVVQKALFRKSELLFKMKRWEELVPTLEKIISRYDNEKYPHLKNAVSKAVMRRAISLLKLNRSKEALPALNQVIARFKDSDNQDFYNQASHAMLYKAQILENSGDSQELLPLYNTIVDRLDESSEIQMLEKLDGIYLKRFDLILETNKKDQILDASSKLIERFKGSGRYTNYIQKAMIKRAETLDSMNRDEEALTAYDEFLDMFG